MQCITIAFMDFKKVTNGDEVIVIPVPCSYRDCIELARSDYFRYVGRKRLSCNYCLTLFAIIVLGSVFGFVCLHIAAGYTYSADGCIEGMGGNLGCR